MDNFLMILFLCKKSHHQILSTVYVNTSIFCVFYAFSQFPGYTVMSSVLVCGLVACCTILIKAYNVAALKHGAGNG